jgi:hypothetical protein
VPGIFLLKLPRSKNRSWREVIAIEINPINQTTLSPTKKRRMVIRSSSELNIKSYGSDKNKMEEDWFELVQKHQA